MLLKFCLTFGMYIRKRRVFSIKIKQNIKKQKQKSIVISKRVCYTLNVNSFRKFKGDTPTRFLKSSENRCKELNPTEYAISSIE